MTPNEPSEAQGAIAMRHISEMARMLSDEFYEDGLRQIFSADQLKQISKWCKKRGIDHRQAVVEIVRAGMKAEGIRPSKQ